METVGTFAQPFFEWLLRSTLQASIVVCLILLIQAALRNRLTARWHYALWMILVIRMVLPWAPQSRFSIYNLAAWQRKSVAPAHLVPEQDAESPTASQQPVDTRQTAVGAQPAATAERQGRTLPESAGTSRGYTESAARAEFALVTVLPLIWLAGMVLLGGYIIISNLRLWQAASVECPSTDKDTLELLEECRAAIGLRTIVALVPSETINTPVLLGFVRPRLLVPKSMAEKLNREELRYVFLHELAHVKRHDIAVGWLTTLLQVLHWFNPFVWLAFHRMRSNRESACDALVLSRMKSEETQSYGRAIVSLLEHFSVPQALPGLAGILESKSQLKRRIAMITQFKHSSYRWSPLAAVLIIILAFISLPDAKHTEASESSTGESSHQPKFTKIWIPTKPGNGVLSPDGKKLAFLSEGSIWVVPVHGKVSPDIAGEPVRLTEPMGAWDVASFIAWSADGKWIAFNVSDEKEDAIYVIRSSGGTPKKVPVEPRLRNSVPNYRLSLSPDGKVVAFCSRYIDKSGVEPPEEPGLPPAVRGFFIYTVPVTGGEVRRLTDSASGEPAFSPDGKKIAFVKYYTPEQGQLCGSLWVVPSEGGNPVQVSDSDPRIRVGGPVWSADGKMIAYTTRTISARKEVCIVPVSQTGKALASPTKIELPLNTLDMLAGWTCDNKIGVFLHKPAQWAIHTVPASGGHAVQVSPSGGAAHPQWSPDGKRIYFRWDGGEIAHVPSGGGAPSIGPVKRDETFYLVYPGSGNAVSPDGREIVFCAGKRISPNNKEPYWEVNIYTVPVEGGEPTKIAQEGRYPCWSPDGKSIAFIRTNQRPVKNESGWNIFIVSSKGGDVRQLTSDSDDVRRTYIDFSPDGKSIAYFAKDRTLRIITVQGGESRIVATAEDLKNHDQLVWSPDGSKLVYSSKGSIWAVSSDGGEPKEIRTGLDAKAAHVSFSPDGRKLAFTAITDGEEDLYLIENFLPEAPVVKPKPTTTLRQIEVRGRGRIHSQPSFDGRYMSDVDDTGNLVVRELATGKERNLTKKDSRTESKDRAHRSLISPDGTKVAYSWFNAETEDFDLRVVGFDGSDDRLLWGSEEGARAFNMGAWSPDGRYIFGKFFGQNDQLMRISIEDGSRQIVRTFDGKGLSKVDVSSDGRYVAYAVAGKTTSNRDIFVFDLETNEETPLVEHPANDKLLGWTPDGQHIFFASDRNGTWDGWLVRIVEGKRHGIPEVVKPGIGNVVPVGFTRNGSFYYAFQHEAWNVYTATLDSNTGEVVSDPEPVRHVGRDIRPDWSRDGRYIAYLSEIDRSKPQIIRIRTLATGKERELKINVPRFDWLRWCPDSRHLLITSFNRGSPSVVYKLDAQTGEYTALVKSDEQRIRQAELSADGKTLAYRTRGLGNANRLIVRDMETGREKELLRTDVMDAAYLSPFAGGWSLSPDGKQVALVVREGEGDEPLKPLVLKVLSITSGELKTLVGAPVGELTWTRDGSNLLFVKDLNELWRVSAKGGEPRRLWKWKQMIWGPRIHPDGQRIAFFSGGNMSEMWVMENFLPKDLGK